MPVCIPPTDCYGRPIANYITKVVRPLPESKVREFGKWIVKESWNSINSEDSSTDQASCLENILIENLNIFCP